MAFHSTGQSTTSRYTWAWGIGILLLTVTCFNKRFWLEILIRWNTPFLEQILLLAITAASITWYLFIHQEVLRSRPRCTYLPGLAFLLAGLLVYAQGGFWYLTGYHKFPINDAGIMLSVLGMSVALTGWKWTRVLWFPLICLFLVMLKCERVLPDFLISQLQELTNWLLILVFRLMNLIVSTGIETDGPRLLVPDGASQYIPINIAEGALHLNRMTLHIILGMAVAFLYYRWWLQRLVVTLAILPVWLILNVVGLAVGILSFAYTPESLQWGPEVIWVALFSFLLMLAVYVLVLAAWGWIWKFAVVQTDEVQADETQEAPPEAPHPQTKPVTKMRAPAAPTVAKVVASLLLGLVCAALILGLATSLIVAATRVFSPAQYFILIFVLAMVLPIGLQFIFKRRDITKPGTSALIMPIIAGMLTANLLGGLLHADPWEAEPERLTRELSSLPHKVGAWEMNYEPPRLSPEIEDELGTREYLIRHYRDIQTHQRLQLMVQFFSPVTGAIPYVPESAFGAGGLQQLHRGHTDLKLDGDVQFDIARSHANPDGNQPVDLRTINLKALVLTFDGDYRSNNKPIHVISFFVTRDAFLTTHHDMRWALHGKRGKAFEYYCKVQLTIEEVRDRDEAEAVAAGFLSDMLPHIMSCMPGSGEQTEAP